MLDSQVKEGQIITHWDHRFGSTEIMDLLLLLGTLLHQIFMFSNKVKITIQIMSLCINKGLALFLNFLIWYETLLTTFQVHLSFFVYQHFIVFLQGSAAARPPPICLREIKLLQISWKSKPSTNIEIFSKHSNGFKFEA